MPFDKDLEAPVLKTKNLTEDSTSYDHRCSDVQTPAVP